MELSNNNLLEIYSIVFSRVHGDGFKRQEVKDLLFESDYFFIETPNPNWVESVVRYFELIGYPMGKTQMNRFI